MADLLDTSSASVNSALQRARATMAERGLSTEDPAPTVAEADEALAARFLDSACPKIPTNSWADLDAHQSRMAHR